MVIRTTTLALILLLMVPLSLMAAQVTAVADRDRLTEGESLQLELRVQGSPDGDADLSPLDKDWDILSRSRSSQMQIINGSFNRSLVLSLTLMPRHSGELQIPAICFGGDCSVPLPIQVNKQAATSESGTAPLLLEAEATPRQALVGEQILLKVRLLHRVDLAQASLSDPKPQGVEAEIQQLGKDRNFETRRHGYLYQAIERRYALFPQKSGTLHIPELQLDAQVPAPPSHFDPFGGALKQVRRYSKALDIQIDPPPGDPGSRQWLPARNLTLKDDWQTHPPALRVGEPATRTLTLRASGLSAARLPELKLAVPAGWKSYPDQPSREDGDDQDGIIGTLRQKIALVPTRPGDVELPAIDLDWYDVTARQWRHAHLDPVLVTVAPAASGTLTPAPPAPPQPVPPTPAKNTTPPTSAAAPQAMPPAGAPAAGYWPWISLFLASGWMLSLLLLWRRRNQRPKPVREQAGQVADAREKDLLKAIMTASGNNDPKATREALLAWSRRRWPNGNQDLERLAEICAEPLSGELERLKEALYAPAGRAWQGAGLAEALQSWLKQQQNRPQPDMLPQLYPGRNGRSLSNRKD